MIFVIIFKNEVFKSNEGDSAVSMSAQRACVLVRTGGIYSAGITPEPGI